MNIVSDVKYSEFIVESEGKLYRMRRVTSAPEVNGFPIRWDIHKQVGWVKVQDHNELEQAYQTRIVTDFPQRATKQENIEKPIKSTKAKKVVS